MMKLNLVHVFLSHNSWDMNMLMMCLPAEVVDITSMIPISYSTDAVDRIIWKATSNG